MKLFRKIDTVTGNFLEDVLFESHPTMKTVVRESITFEDGKTEIIEREVDALDGEGNPILDAQYVEEVPKQGFYLPRWNGTEWVEGGVAPEPTEAEPQVSTMEEMAIALMKTQAELEEAQAALDFILMEGI